MTHQTPEDERRAELMRHLGTDGIGTKVLNMLIRENNHLCPSLEQVQGLTDEQILNIKGFGSTCLYRIRDGLYRQAPDGEPQEHNPVTHKRTEEVRQTILLTLRAIARDAGTLVTFAERGENINVSEGRSLLRRATELAEQLTEHQVMRDVIEDRKAAQNPRPHSFAEGDEVWVREGYRPAEPAIIRNVGDDYRVIVEGIKPISPGDSRVSSWNIAAWQVVGMITRRDNT